MNERKVQEDPSSRSFFKMPHTYAIIMGILLISVILTYTLPAGQFDREKQDGQTVVIDGTYRAVESAPVNLFGLFEAIPKGMEAGAGIIFYIFLVGGVFGIIRETGAIESGINQLINRFGQKGHIMIPMTMFVFSVAGATIGMAEETIIFVPIGIMLARALGYDAMTGAAIVSLGAAVGFAGGMLNPFTVGVAQSIAEVPLFSGIGYRTAIYLAFLLVTILYVMNYAQKVKKNPERSLVYDLEKHRKEETTTTFSRFSKKHAFVLIVLIGGITLNVIGIFEWGWYLTELTASFLIIGMLAGIATLGVNRTFESLIDGAKAVTFGALIVGFARAIVVILEDGRVIDTVIYGLSNAVGHLPTSLAVIGMYIVQLITNFFIPSGSGQAATTMPIMAPLADLLGIERQVAVLAFQYGDGLTNMIFPTSAHLMAFLAIAGIPYEKWLRFVWKLFAIWVTLACVALLLAVTLGIQ
ncbi:YfcC family protein [Exiguobacterium oxidotolerans]|uniref:YfcC family protein n=1 Tax=Exiguobacterium oxidotolerans TaxID=223958 RepID=UPI00049478CD|nr:Na+/H+ antiporter NhaC family protein [Exiguobacterium oxidotolerans]